MKYSVKKLPAKFPCRFLTWEEIEDITYQLAEKIAKSGYRPDVIVAVARGGLVGARLVSDVLGVTDFACLRIAHWGETAVRGKEARLERGIGGSIEGKRVLLIDDVTDTGKSLTVAKSYLETLSPKEVKTAALQYIRGSSFVPDYFGKEEKEWAWFAYPWNRWEDLRSLTLRIVSEDNRPHFTKEVAEKFMEYYGVKVTPEIVERTFSDLEGKGYGKKLQDSFVLSEKKSPRRPSNAPLPSSQVLLSP